MKLKFWILILAILIIIIGYLPWLSTFQKYLILFIYVAFGHSMMIYNAIKSRNSILIVVNVSLALIVFYLIFYVIQRYI